jgi:hypothetical protein
MVASCAGAALGCYLVSLRVASERAALESVETRIVLAQRDIRLLQTEIGTRGRLAQLERWNVKVLALSAPSADQFLDGGFALAKMVAPQHNVDLEAPVVLASAPAIGPRPQVEGQQRPDQDQDEAGVSARQMLHTASLTREITPAPERAVAAPKPSPAPAKPIANKAPAKPAPLAIKPVTTAKAPAAAKSRPTKFAQAEPAAQDDPLAPRPARSGSHSTTKDSGSKQ